MRNKLVLRPLTSFPSPYGRGGTPTKSGWVRVLCQLFGILLFAHASSAIPIIGNEEVTSLTDTTAIITWTTTNESSDAKVYYGITAPTAVSTSTESTIYHYMSLTGLNPGTIYKYYVKSGTTEASQKTFTTLTPPSGTYLFTFATLSDPQYGMGKADTTGARGRPYSKSAEILGSTITNINAHSPAFTILKGDLNESSGGTYGNYVNTTNIPGDTKTIKGKLDELTSVLPYKYFPIPGNHDKVDAAYTAGIANRRWYDNNLYHLYALGVADPTADSCFNYSFSYNGYHFIMLDSVMASLSAEVNTTYLSAQLSAANTAGQKCFIFLHHPITDLRSEGIPTDVITEVTGGTSDYNKIQIMNSAEVQALVTTYKDIIAGVFSGHIHDNNYTTVSGVPVVRTAAGVQFPTGYNVYKVYSNGYMQTFYKIPYYTELAREMITPEAGYNDAYWEQFSLGPNNARNFVYTLSAAAPSVSTTIPTTGATAIAVNENVIIRFSKAMSQTDTQSAVTFSPSISGTTNTWTGSDTLTISHSAFAASTAYTVTVETGAKDSSGTAMSAAHSFSFTTGTQTDTIPPVAAFFAFALNISSDNQPTFTGIATDELSSITSIECRIDGGAWYPASPSDQKFNSLQEDFYFKAPTNLLRGYNTHTIEARCTDAAQNTTASSFPSYSFYIVGDKPEIGIWSNGLSIISGDPVGANPSFEAKVVSNKGLTTYGLYAIVDSGTPVLLTKTVDPDNSGIITATYNPALTDGTHTLRIMMTDNEGNVSTGEVVGLVVQATSDTLIQGIPLNYPNPYNGTGNVTISYILSKNDNVNLTVHDLMGNKLVGKTYVSGQTGAKAGYNEITWNGKTDAGEDLGTGVYVYFIIADGKVIGKGKLTVAK